MNSVTRRNFLTMAALGPVAAASLPAAASAPSPTGAAVAAVAGRGHITGLLARDPERVTPEGAARLTGFVQPLRWADAQPTAGGQITDSALETLASAVELARANGYPRLKLRLLAGCHSPDWALQLGGAPLAGWQEPEGATTWTVPRWWATEFLEAYRAFVDRLADHLGDPEWCEVTVSGSCTVFTEPLIHQLGVAANRSLALAAAYRVDEDEAAFRKAVSDQHAILGPLGISSSVAYNPWQTIDTRGRLAIRPEKTIEFLTFQRALAGQAGIWENNSLIARRLPDGTTEQTRTDYQPMYDHMTAGAAQGHPTQFQTATLAKIFDAGGTPYDTASWAADSGALSVELPAGWERHGPNAEQAADLNRRMAANARIVPTITL
jgi:hypothetical protein